MLQVANGGPETLLWTDVAEVKVPSGTKRKTALLKAAEAWGEEVPEGGVRVRLVPLEHLVVSTLRPKPPTTPELEVI